LSYKWTRDIKVEMRLNDVFIAKRVNIYFLFVIGMYIL
jgi:hypothetical protein